MAKIGGPDVLPHNHAALIGRFADAWAQLEYRIDEGIWHLANAEQQLAACITSQFVSIHPRMKAFIALAMVRGAASRTIGDLNRFYSSLNCLAETRNRRIHDPRFRDEATGTVHRLEIKAKPKVEFDFIPEPKDDFAELISSVWEKITEFTKLRDTAVNEVASTVSRLISCSPENGPGLISQATPTTVPFANSGMIVPLIVNFLLCSHNRLCHLLEQSQVFTFLLP